MTSKIELLGMHFRSRHGCLESERILGGEFIVDVSFDADTAAAERSDDLHDTVDYSVVYSIVEGCMAVPSNLLEHVAGRIADGISEAFPQVSGLQVSVSKKNPPVGGECEWARVTVRR